MSLKGKYTTIYDIVERVRRTGINDFTMEEAIEWTWEIISLMGVPSFYYNRVAILLVENARATLPYDLSDISEGGIRDYYSKTVLVKESDIFYTPENVGKAINSNTLAFEAPSYIFTVDGEEVDITENVSFLANYSQSAITREDYTYRINNGFVETGFKDGIIELAYKAFPVDNENNPMIEDNVKVIRAVVYYIMEQVADRMSLRDEISEQKAMKISRKRAWAVSSARSDANLGSIDDWEAIRSRTNRLYRDPNMHGIGFKGMSYREGLNLG